MATFWDLKQLFCNFLGFKIFFCFFGVHLISLNAQEKIFAREEVVS
jgi:hypothetical protein